MVCHRRLYKREYNWHVDKKPVTQTTREDRRVFNARALLVKGPHNKYVHDVIYRAIKKDLSFFSLPPPACPCSFLRFYFRFVLFFYFPERIYTGKKSSRAVNYWAAINDAVRITEAKGLAKLSLRVLRRPFVPVRLAGWVGMGLEDEGWPKGPGSRLFSGPIHRD